VIVEATVIKKNGPDDNLFGIICRYQSSSNFYLFIISSDGQAGIAVVTNPSGPTLLKGAELKPVAAINQGNAANRLRASCAGNQLSLEVNDELVASTTDGTIAGGGDAGLWLNTRDTPGVDLYFDDFIVQKP